MLSHALRAKVQNSTIPTATDTNFKQVSLLLHGDGTNGAQNNTFIGEVNPAQYYGSFNGSTQYLTVPNTAFNFGTGSFTVEFYYYYTSGNTSYNTFFDNGGQGVFLSYETGSTLLFYSAVAQTSTPGKPHGMTLNSWNHLAFVRNGTTLTIYVNGNSIGSWTGITGSMSPVSGTSAYIGQYSAGGPYYINGRISNFRVVKGTAVYTANFTPPTGNLTAISGTQLLTLQNATIVDNSTNNFTITNNGSVAMTDQYPTVTRNGNTTQGTNTPFSQAAGYWSNYNPANSTYLTATGSAIDFGTGDFTVEAWVYPTTMQTYNFPIASTGSNNYFGFASTGYLTCYATSSGSDRYQTSGTAVTVNQWNHIAFTRSSGTLYFFVNGSLVGTFTSWTYSISSTTAATIGASTTYASYGFIGYMSNVRLVKGTAVYTSAFTPSTTPLTAITNTSLLTCQSNYFKDNSSNNYALTVTGTPSVQPFSPFAPTSAYSTSVNGGSMYFDGTGDYLNTSSSANFNPGTGDFTVEGWMNFNTGANIAGGYNAVFCYGSYSLGNEILIRFPNGNNFEVYINSSTTGTATISPALIANQWYHFALTRSSGSLRKFINGVQVGTTQSNTVNLNTTSTCIIGADRVPAIGEYFYGILADVRYVVGTAVYTASFTPPTTPLTAITNTQLLLSGTNAGIYDNAIKNDLETVGDAQISTAVVKYGTGSLKFDGTGDSLTLPAVQQFAYGTGDFTIEFWFNASDTTWRIMYEQTAQVSIQWSSTSGGGGGAGKVGIYANGGYVITNNTALSTGTWYFLALVRQSGVLKLYIDGVAQTTTYAFANNLVASSQPLIYVGNYFGGGYSWNGYLDDLRVTKGIARYTANFTPPTAAFPNQ